MTDFLEPTVAGRPSSGSRLPADPALWTVRQLVAALAELEDALRNRPTSPDEHVPPYLQAAIDREQAILAELHRRSPADTVAAAEAATATGLPVTSLEPVAAIPSAPGPTAMERAVDAPQAEPTPA